MSVGAKDTRAGRQPGRGSRERVQSIARGLSVLALLNQNGAGTISQLAAALDLKRSTVHRILGVLVDLGLVIHDPLSHLYLLGAGADDLSNRFCDEDWIASVAEPRMSDWTQERRWPLVLVTAFDDGLVVRVSTDCMSPVAGDRLVVGQSVPVEGSVPGALDAAWRRTRSGEGTEPDARIREQGFAASPPGVGPDAWLAVPLLSGSRYLGSISMRCLPEMIESPPQLQLWLAALRQLGEDIAGEAGPLPPPPDRGAGDA